MIIDFKEIPIANSGNGDQDTFEKFSRDFLELIGYQILGEPSRGVDGGIDIKVLEKREGIAGITNIYWLVSCKHYAQTGISISPSIEQNILDRVLSHNCDGFIGFYSTIASSGLKDQLERFSKNQISYQIFDNEKIENRIIGIKNMENLFMRYFPISYKNWKHLYYYTEPINLFNFYIDKKYEDDKNLLTHLFGSIGNTIKVIRNTSSFENALESYNVKIIIEPLLTKYMLSSQALQYNNLENYSLRDAIEKHIPNEIEHKYRIKIHPKPRILSVLFDEDTSFILYPNALIVNQHKNNFFNTMFEDLKSMLS